MGSEGEPELKRHNELQIFKDFLSKNSWLLVVSSLAGFSKALVSASVPCFLPIFPLFFVPYLLILRVELLQQPPISRNSELIDNIIKANETERVKSYVVAGCVNTHDRVQNISKLNTCLLGLQGHLTQAKSIINELENLLADLTAAIKTSNRSFSPMRNGDLRADSDQQTTINQEESPSSNVEQLEMTDYAALMGIIYSMLKQDYVMQEKIVSSLNFKSSAGELESYCLMWSLRPFINDEIVMQAWRCII